MDFCGFNDILKIDCDSAGGRVFIDTDSGWCASISTCTYVYLNESFYELSRPCEFAVSYEVKYLKVSRVNFLSPRDPCDTTRPTTAEPCKVAVADQINKQQTPHCEPTPPLQRQSSGEGKLPLILRREYSVAKDSQLSELERTPQQRKSIRS